MTLVLCALVLATPAAAQVAERALPSHRANAGRQVRLHSAQLRWTSLEMIKTRHAIEVRRRREQRQLIARLHAASPVNAIRVVFGRYAAEALAVARCESGLSQRAQNGQYLGLFQMGVSERTRYGHGASPYAQARAAHSYFVDAGRSWSPWTCRPT